MSVNSIIHFVKICNALLKGGFYALNRIFLRVTSGRLDLCTRSAISIVLI